MAVELEPKEVQRRAAAVLDALRAKGLVLGRHLSPHGGKHQTQTIVARVGPGGRGVDPNLVVAGVGGQSLAALLGQYLVEGHPSAERLTDWIIKEFEVAEAAA